MKNYSIGIDIGGTTVKLGVFDISGTLLEKWEIDTNKAESGKNILPDIVSSINNRLGQRNIPYSAIKGIGVGIPGPILKNGFVPACVNLGWKNMDVKKELEKRIELPVYVANDANVAALGEMWRGSGKGYKNLVMITLGTGVGGGVVVNEKVVSGLFGGAGELGHMPVVYDEVVNCACGKKGCLEQAASATGIVKEAKKLLMDQSIKSMLREEEELTAKQVFDLAKTGDEIAIKVMERACKYLGFAMASITSVLDPEVYILGGGVSKAGQILIDTIKKYYQLNVLYMCKDTEIKLATLGNDAGIYGAARMVL
jgi:glucokinase